MITILVPVYNEVTNVPLLHTALKPVLTKLGDHEIIFIDDGSNDGTVDAIKKLAKSDGNTRAIFFRKNFGKSAALSAGSAAAKGDIIITMDGDLQDDPLEIPRFVDKIKEGYDLVVGWKYPRLDPFSKLFFSRIFNRLTSALVGLRLHDYNCGFKAYKRDALKGLKLHSDLHRYIPALLYWTGYKVCEIKIKHHPRKHGVSKYGISRVFKGFFDLLAIKFLHSYKRKPLLFFGATGAVSFSLGVLIALYLLGIYLINGTLQTRPLIFLSMLLVLLGVQLFSLGFLGVLVVDATVKPEEQYDIQETIR